MPRHRWTRTRTTKEKLKRQPVLAAVLAPAVVWVVARFGVHVDADTATYIAGVLLAVLAYLARKVVTPVYDPELPPDQAAADVGDQWTGHGR